MMNDIEETKKMTAVKSADAGSRVLRRLQLNDRQRTVEYL